jgi:CRISPR-associated endonuclease/helicase Cas3
MVCDLSTFESMAQRFGRVNRYGERSDTRIDVVYPTKFDDKDKLAPARKATFDLLGRLHGDASPKNLGELMTSLTEAERKAAFAPPPTILPATDILFDAWALTSIRDKMPGRPAVEPYLHGRSSWEPPETHVAWREEVEVITGDLLAEYRPIDLLDDYPLRPHELLRDATERRNTGVLAQITCIAKRCPDANVWIVDAQGGVSPAKLKDVVEGDSRRLHGATVLLPPCVGGLSAGGMLDGDAEFDEQLKYDVADIDLPNDKRIRVWSNDDAYEAKTAGMRRVCPPIEFPSVDDEDEPRRWEWFESIPQEGGSASNKAVTWQTHVGDVVSNARRIVEGLHLPTDIANAVVLAAELHDHGKRRAAFQTALGNRLYPDVLLAKSGRDGSRLPELFRHEFGSLLDVLATSRARQQAGASSAAPDRSLTVAARTDLEALAAFDKLSDDMQDLALHLIAAHHGRARPHFTLDEIIDIERSSTDAEAMAMETPRRFARLQRKYGRWGLAYLESLLRAADWSASAEPSKVLDAQGKEVTP